jgi:hypothetical protein
MRAFEGGRQGTNRISGRSRIFASGIGWRFQNRLLGPSGRGCHELIFNGTLPALEDKISVTGARDKVLKSSSRGRQAGNAALYPQNVVDPA